MYLRAAKTDAEEAGESTEGMANSVSELREEILDLTGQQVDIQIDDDTFKSTYQILAELSKVWDDLTDVSQANLLELVGGKRNANVVSALLENFSVAEEALKSSMNAVGSAVAENEKHLDSIQGKIAEFKAQFESLSTTFIKSEFIKGVVEFGTFLLQILEGVGNIINALGGLNTVLTVTLGLLAIIKADSIVGILSKTGNAISSIIPSVITLVSKFKDFGVAIQLAGMKYSGFEQMSQALNAIGISASTAQVAMVGFIAAAASIYLVVKAVDYFNISISEAKENLEDLTSEMKTITDDIQSISSDFSSLKSGADEIIPRFAELANGVNKFGENVSLTDEEYNEFLSLNNQLADIFPQINAGMDSNGNAMLSLSLSSDSLTNSLKKLVDAEREVANIEIVSKLPDVLDNLKESDKNFDILINDVEDKKKKLAEAYALLSDPSNYTKTIAQDSDEIIYWSYDNILKRMGVDVSHDIISQDGQTITYGSDFVFDTSEVEKNYANALEGLEKQAYNLEQQAAAKWKSVNPIISAWLQTDYTYNELNDSMQSIVRTMVSGLDFSSLGLTTQSDVENYLYDYILMPLYSASPEIRNAFADITNWQEQLRDGKVSEQQFSDHITYLFNSLISSMDPDKVETFKTIFVNSFNAMGVSGTDFETVLSGMITEWAKIPTVVTDASGAIDIFASVSQNIDDTKNKIDTLSGAFEKLSDGSLEIWDVIKLLEQFPELSEYVDLTADGFGDLDKGLQTLIKNSPVDLIDTLQEFKTTRGLTEEQAEQVDNLCSALSNLPTNAIKDASGEFGVLADAINAATDAQNDLEKALAEDDWDSGYEGRVDAYEGFEDVLDAGEYGSKAYAAYKEYFGLIEKTPDQIREWMESNEKYFTESTDGILSFLQTVELLSEEGGALDGIASFDADSGVFWYDINKLSEFADALGWTEEMLQDFIYKYRMYVEEWTSRSPQDTLTELSNAKLVLDIGDSTFASLNELIEYTGLSKEEVLALVDAMNELRAQQGQEQIQIIGSDKIAITQQLINSLLVAGAEADRVKDIVLELAQQDGIEIDLDAHLYGQTVSEMIAEATGDGAESVSVDIKMNVNDEEVITTVTTTAEQIKTILGEGWEAKIDGNTLDAETDIETVSNLLNGLPEDTLVTVTDETLTVRSNLSTVIDYLNTIEANKSKEIVVTWKTSGIPHFASGTSRAKRGLALLGDEYSASGTPKPELVVSGDQAYIAGINGPEIGFLQDGDVVYTADETKKIVGMHTLNGSIPAHAGGTASGLKDIGAIVGGSYNFSGEGSSSSSNKTYSSKKDDEESWFERQYKDHQHWLEMDKESVSEYLGWLDDAYQKAYNEGIIELDDYYKYQEEVYKGVQDLFKDHLSDIDHEISLLESGVGNSDEIIDLSLKAIEAIEKEIDAAYAAGLDNNGDYIQYLENQWSEYTQTIIDLREDAEAESESTINDLVEYRIKMLKAEIEAEKDALDQKLSDIKDFYDKQREMLQDQADEEKYLEEQTEKRKSVTDIRAELAMLERDNSAWAQKRKMELQAELADAEKELNSFEKDHALDVTLDMLDEQQAAQEAQIQAQIDALDKKLNDPHALFNQALEDIKNNTAELYQEFIAYNRKYGSGNDKDIADMWEGAYKADLDYQETHGGAHLDGIAIGNYTGYTPPANITPPEGTYPTKPDNSAEESNRPSLEVGSTVQVKKSATHFGPSNGRVSMASFVPGGTYTVYGTNSNEVLIGQNGVYTGWVNKSDIVGYKHGTNYSVSGLAEFDEDGKGSEYIFESSDGNRYRMFGEGSKVLNSDATQFLYDFATSGGGVLKKMLTTLFGLNNLGNIAKPIQAIELNAGDIIIQGNASERTVSEIRRAQRESLKFVMTELNKLNK